MISDSNPYRAPDLSAPISGDASQPTSRFQIVIWALAYFYPVWLVSSFYLTWLIAWIQLGHRPRPMLDDPKSIGGLMDIVYYLPGILAIAIPVLAPIGFLAAFFCPLRINRIERYSLRMSLAFLYVVLCVLALIVLRADIGRVVEWWFD